MEADLASPPPRLAGIVCGNGGLGVLAKPVPVPKKDRRKSSRTNLPAARGRVAPWTNKWILVPSTVNTLGPRTVFATLFRANKAELRPSLNYL